MFFNIHNLFLSLRHFLFIWPKNQYLIWASSKALDNHVLVILHQRVRLWFLIVRVMLRERQRLLANLRPSRFRYGRFFLAKAYLLFRVWSVVSACTIPRSLSSVQSVVVALPRSALSVFLLVQLIFDLQCYYFFLWLTGTITSTDWIADSYLAWFVW